MYYTKILDKLYLGSYNDIIKDYHKAVNTDVIINVAKECKKIDDTVEYYYYGYDDSPTDNLYNNFDEVVDLIHFNIKSNKIVFIHCYAGKSRSATFVIIYLIKHRGFDLKSAYEYVNNLRDIYPNLGFVSQMMCYEIEKTNNSTLNYDNIVIDYIYSVTGFISKEQVTKIYYENNKDINLTMTKIFDR